MNTLLSEKLVEENALESYHLANVSFEGLRQKCHWPMFELGKIWVSPFVANELSEVDVKKALHQHGSGSWGILGPSDWKANNFSLDAGLPVLSLFEAEDGTMFMVLTDFDRQLTEVLLPREL